MTIEPQHLVLFANTDWYLYNFRIGLARRIREQGHAVTLVSPDGEYASRLADEFDWRPLDLSGGSKGPISNLAALQRVHSLYRDVRPDLVHHFTIKCVLFGGLVARQMNIPAVHAVTGLGHVFTDDSVSNRCVRQVIRPMYRRVFSAPRTRVIFQNTENRDFFIDAGLANLGQTDLIRGSGADCDRFVPSDSPRRPGPCRLLFASRLMREKGIRELLDAVNILKADGVAVELQVAGDVYPGNPSSLNKDEFDELKRSVTYLGHVDDMRPLFHDADVVVLPSYAEGTPRVLLEAGACGKPLIATDVAGCRGVVVDGQNGFLVPPRESTGLAEAIRTLVEDSTLRESFGKASREVIVGGFSERSVNERTLEVYQRVLESRS